MRAILPLVSATLAIVCSGWAPPPGARLRLRKRRAASAEAAEPAGSADDSDSVAASKDPAASAGRTSSIGGKWAPPTADLETHNPKVSTWGVFERPADISAAYGGGKRVGKGYGDSDSAEAKAKAAETAARLAKFRAGRDTASMEVAKQHAGDVDEAVETARRALSRGFGTEAVDVLERAKKYMSLGDSRGCSALLELALAYENAGDRASALKLYTSLKNNSSSEQVRKQASRLRVGMAAMDEMRYTQEATQYSDLMKTATTRKWALSADVWEGEDNYDSAYFNPDNLEKRKQRASVDLKDAVATRAQAVAVLSRAVTGRGAELPSALLWNALRRCSDVAPLEAPDGDADDADAAAAALVAMGAKGTDARAKANAAMAAVVNAPSSVDLRDAAVEAAAKALEGDSWEMALDAADAQVRRVGAGSGETLRLEAAGARRTAWRSSEAAVFGGGGAVRESSAVAVEEDRFRKGAARLNVRWKAPPPSGNPFAALFDAGGGASEKSNLQVLYVDDELAVFCETRNRAERYTAWRRTGTGTGIGGDE